MTPDDFRIEYRKQRWYVDPLPADDRWEFTTESWPAVSTVKKAWDKPYRKQITNEHGDTETVPWAAWACATHVVANRHHLTNADEDALFLSVARAAERTLTKAADRGTELHRIVELLAGGQAPMLLEPDAEPYLPAVHAFLDECQPTYVATEQVVIAREHPERPGWGGTFDAILVLDGVRYLTDYKSRSSDKHAAYAEEAVACAAYARADYCIAEVDGAAVREDIPPVDAGLIVTFTADGRYELHPIDLDHAWLGWEAMLRGWTMKKTGQSFARKAIGKPIDKAKLSTVEPTPVAGVPGAAPVEQGAGDAHAPAPADRVEWLRQRAALILAHEKAKDTLLRRWPEGVPTFKQGGHTADHAALIEAVLDGVEADHELPFGAPPPAEPKAEPDDPFAGINGEATRPDEGPTVDPDDIAALSRLIVGLGDDRVVLDAWASATFLDGGRSISVKLGPTRWRYAVARALTLAVQAGVTNDDDLRTVLYGATLCDDVLMPAIPVGKAIASLTIEEADRAAHIAQHLGTPDLALSFDEAGKPVFTGTAYDGLHAA